MTHENEIRAARLDKTFKVYHEELGEGPHAPDDSSLSDLLTDLRHWAHREGFSFEEAVLTSEINYNAETED